jgi:putative ABC transport system permease protein
MVMTALNRKLWRDLRSMRGQAIAIALVVAAGVSLYVTYLANFESLRRTQHTYYQQQRFGDVFASLKRAPVSLGADIASIPGVTAFETRVVAEVRLEMPAMREPVHGRLVSIDAIRRPLVNDLYLRTGRWIDAARPEEVLVSEGFAEAHGLAPGDAITAVINGTARDLTIAGVALSPEYVYCFRPSELVPDDRRYGVFWMDRRALAAVFDMEGGFNDVTLDLAAGVNPEGPIQALDRLVEKYGGLGAMPRELQLSHWMLESELRQLESVGVLLPAIFLVVAAFVLNVALTRALTLQRPQIAALKALGYADAAIAWHYIKWALVIATGGLLVGVAAGAWLGSIVGDLYNRYFRFPELVFVVPIRTLGGAAVLTLGAAIAGAYSAVHRAVRIPPADAMRPEAPARYRRSIIETAAISRTLGVVGRMVMRNLTRHPLRAAASICGIAAAVALLMVGLVMFDAMDRLITTQFWIAERQDAALAFVEPRSADVRHELARLPGVITVETQRHVPVRVRAGHRDRYLSVIGIRDGNRFQRIVDEHGNVARPSPSGVLVSAALAERLGVGAGSTVDLEVLEGARRARRVQVAGIVEDVLGLSIYMEMSALHRLLREGDTVSAALLQFDPALEDRLSEALRAMPGVGGVTFKRTVLRKFRETIAATMDMTIFINVVFAAIIAMGVVYNAARVALSERSHELASLRVLGYTRAEISLILLSEIAVLTVAALPLGWLFGYGLAVAIFQTVQSEVYRFPLYVSPAATAWASLGIIAASVCAGLIVRRRLDRLDLIAVLKVRE